MVFCLTKLSAVNRISRLHYDVIIEDQWKHSVCGWWSLHCVESL